MDQLLDQRRAGDLHVWPTNDRLGRLEGTH